MGCKVPIRNLLRTSQKGLGTKIINSTKSIKEADKSMKSNVIHIDKYFEGLLLILLLYLKVNSNMFDMHVT
jgi:hypothetical protein